MTPTREPAAYAEVVRLVLVAIVTLGWVTLDDVTTNAIATAVGTLISIGLSLTVRAHVTPTGTDPAEPTS